MKPKKGELPGVGSSSFRWRCILLFGLFKIKPKPEPVVLAPSAENKPHFAHPLRGWTNVGLYEVHGVNPKTGRSNKKMIEALSEGQAVAAAVAAGLADPITVSEVPQRMATDRQIEFAESLGEDVPAGATLLDASALICRVQDGETEEKAITQEQWAAAWVAGVPMSALAGQKFYRSAMKGAKL